MSTPLPALGSPARERLGIVLLAVAFSAVAVVPFHFMGRAPAAGSPWRVRMPVTHDVAMHFDHMRSFYRGLAAGRLLPRWEEEANRGFGAPSTSFHPPAIYYLTSLIRAAVGDWGLTFLVTHLLVMIASAVALYRYARQSLSRPAAGVAMVAYVLYPYHLLDLYQRGAMAEWLSFVFMPLVWLFAERLFEVGVRPRSLSLAGLAAAYGAFLLSHPPTCHQFTMALGVLALVLAVRRRNPRGLVYMAGALALGAGLSAVYFYPALVEQGLIRRDLFRSVWAYGDNYVLAARPAQAPSEFWALVNRTWLFGAAGLAAATAALLASGAPTRHSDRVVGWVAVGAFVSVMMTPPAAPLERLVPGIEMTSFPWRMLSIGTLVLALLTGALTEAAAKGRRAACGGAAAGLLLGGLAFSVALVAGPRWNAPVFQPRPDRPPADVYWMIPLGAPADARGLPRMERAALGRGTGRIAIERWEPESRVLAVEVPASDRLLVRTFDFPGWMATLDGRPASIERGAELGNIEIDLPPGAHRVTLEMVATPARRLGAAITLASALALGVLVLRGARSGGGSA